VAVVVVEPGVAEDEDDTITSKYIVSCGERRGWIHLYRQPQQNK